jgi:predicted permease
MAFWDFLRPTRPQDVELDSELRFHLDELTAEKIAAGLPADQARREAVLEFGAGLQIKEALRDVHRIASLDTTAANLKSAVRFMRKSPSFSVAVILTLALGIGANSAVFSAIDAILLRPLPFPHAGELMILQQYDRKSAHSVSPVATVRIEDWNRLNSTFQAISGYYRGDVSERSGALPEKVTEALVAPRFLQVWGLAPALGRDFTPAEEHFGGPNAVLITDRFWRRHFNADANVIGKRIHLESYFYTVIGVMPASFLFSDRDVDLFLPNPVDAPYAQDRSSTWFNVIGRLKPGVSVATAEANLATVQAQLGRQFPKTDGTLGVTVEPLKDSTVGGVRRSLWILFGSVTLLLLIAFTNIAALLLARTAERAQEISVRYSLGATRASLIAQLLTECLLLALTGAAAGLAVAGAAMKTFRSLAKTLPRVEEITIDWRIVLYTLTCALAATLVCGLLPALKASTRIVGRTVVSTRNRLQWLLVGTQVALAVTLLVGAGLLLRTFEELGRVSPGFDPTHVLTFRISGNWGETADMKRLTQRIDRTLEELRHTPGIHAAATTATLPGVGGNSESEFKMPDASSTGIGKIVAANRYVSSGYFETMRIPRLAGETCHPSVLYGNVVVNSAFASAYLGGLTALGHHLEPVDNAFHVPPQEIRGVVADAREGRLNQEPVPTVYWCVSAPGPTPLLLARTEIEPMALAETIRRRIHQIDPSRSVYDLAPLEQFLSDDFAENRLRTMLLALFAITAVTLACIGLYGTLSYFVAIRRREIGLRLALGAVRSQIVGRFLFRGFGVSLLGCLAGLALSATFARVLSGMLYGVSSSDPETYVTAVLGLMAVAAVASVIPALRAARIDPMEALREE